MKNYDPIEMLRERCTRSNQKQVAAELGVSPQYLNDVLARGKEPGEKILKALGLRRVVRYERVPTDPAAP
jgi:hypothetical protein